MQSLYDTGAPAPCPSSFNLAAHVLAAGQATPDKVALAVLSLTDTERWTYGQLRAAILGTATGLLQAGVLPGQTVLMRLGNTVDFPVAFLGAIAAGIVPVPTSSQLTPSEVQGIIDHLSPVAILQGDGVGCPETETSVFDIDTMRLWRDLPMADFEMGAPDRLAYIIYTSGTSGIPRAVGHAHRAIWARQMMMQGWYGLTGHDRLLHAGAFNWTYTLGTGLMDPWTIGATSLIPAAGVGHDQLAQLMQQHDTTIFAAAPGVYRNLLKSPIPPMPKLRHGLAAGEKLSEHIRQDWVAATGTQIYEAFGMSECSTFISSAPGYPATPGTLGRPQPGRRVAILDDAGQIVPRGTPGVIAVHRRDPGLMRGYIGADEATDAKFRGDWFLTGDQGSMDDEDQIHYLGRADDMMNAGGYRVSPLEVEHVLQGHPDISEVGATDIEVKEDVRLIAAFYTGPAPIDETSLQAWAEQRLARYKQPRFFVHVDALPRNPNGKLLRRALKTIYHTRSAPEQKGSTQW